MRLSISIFRPVPPNSLTYSNHDEGIRHVPRRYSLVDRLATDTHPCHPDQATFPDENSPFEVTSVVGAAPAACAAYTLHALHLLHIIGSQPLTVVPIPFVFLFLFLVVNGRVSAPISLNFSWPRFIDRQNHLCGCS